MQAEMAASGEMPLDYLTRIMRDPNIEPHRRSCFDFSPTFTTIAFDNSSLRWLEINT
jgi:hypothetical protein